MQTLANKREDNLKKKGNKLNDARNKMTEVGEQHQEVWKAKFK